MKLRPTLVMYKVNVPGKGDRDVDMPVDYCLGKDIHFTILSHKKELMAMAKNINQHTSLNGLETLEDSIHLL